MPADPISPIAPARVRALLLPVGRIKRSSFQAYVDRLLPEYIVRLGDISQDVRPDRTMFSPLGFASGMMIYDFVTSYTSGSDTAIWPYETFRTPMLVIGIVDGSEYGQSTKDHDVEQDVEDVSSIGGNDLPESMKRLHHDYSKASAIQSLVFNSTEMDQPLELPLDIIKVPAPMHSQTTTMKTVMCDISAKLLAEMVTSARSILDSTSIESPGVSYIHSAVSGSPSSTGSETVSRTNSSHARGFDADPVKTRGTSNDTANTEIRKYSLTAEQSKLQQSSRPGTPANETRKSLPSNLNNDPPTDVLIMERFGRAPYREDDRVRSTSALNYSRESSRNRKNHKPGISASAMERTANKIKARQRLVIGSMYLQAGRWPDALRELADGGTRARAVNDHLWYAKALENILVTLLMLAWAGLGFSIPTVCDSTLDKSSTSRSASTNNVSAVEDSIGADNVNNEMSVHKLCVVLPDLVRMILNAHDRAGTVPGEALAHFPYSQCVTRLSKLLSIIHCVGGQLDREALNAIVCGTPVSQTKSSLLRSPSIRISKQEISSLLFRAYPGRTSLDGMSSAEVIDVFSGIASVLSILNLKRKRGLVMKELITMLVPMVVQEKKIRAAKIGIPPATNLSTLHETTDQLLSSSIASTVPGSSAGFVQLLMSTCESYGLFTRTIPNSSPSSIPFNDREVVDEKSPYQAVLNDELKGHEQECVGSFSLKVAILRLCTELFEAMLDFKAVLRFTATLLKVAGPGCIPGPNFSSSLVKLARDEQIQLATKLYRTADIVRGLDVLEMEPDFWDEYLVRGVRVLKELHQGDLVLHGPSEIRRSSEVIKSAETRRQSPFIHTAFSDVAGNVLINEMLVANEQASFSVRLQNLYAFEVIIECIALIAEGVQLRGKPTSVILGPCCMQDVTVLGTPVSSGKLRITGCRIKVKGCREQNFLIFRDPWMQQTEVKIKQCGLAASSGYNSFDDTQDDSNKGLPTPVTVESDVVKSQPHALVGFSKLSQSMMTVSEGETRLFPLTIYNTSESVSIDYVRIFFDDPLGKAQEMHSKTELSQAALYELEFYKVYRQPFRWRQQTPHDTYHIPPRSSACFDIEVLGRPGLTEGFMTVDYANLDRSLSDVRCPFPTRRVSLPLIITVHGTIQLQRLDMLPFDEREFFVKARNLTHLAWSERDARADTDETLQPTVEKLRSSLTLDNYKHHAQSSFILVLDLKNLSTRALKVKIAAQETSSQHKNEHTTGVFASSTDIIQSGQVVRMFVLVPQLLVENPCQTIPLMEASKRQFVVSDNELLSQNDQRALKLFWYREELLKHVTCMWEDPDSAAQGSADLRPFQLNQRMLDVMRLDDIEIGIKVMSTNKDTNAASQSTRTTFQAKKDELLELTFTLKNRTKRQLHALLSIKSSLSSFNHRSMIHLTSCVAWTGALMQSVPVMQPQGGWFRARLGLTIFATGWYVVEARADVLDPSPSVTWAGDKHSSAEEGTRLGFSSCTILVTD